MKKTTQAKISEVLEYLRELRDDEPDEDAVEVLAHVILELEKLAD